MYMLEDDGGFVKAIDADARGASVSAEGEPVEVAGFQGRLRDMHGRPHLHNSGQPRRAIE